MSVAAVAPAAVDARAWGWRHGGRRSWVLSELTLRVEPGERVLLLGASGAGKSTLLHALAGVLGGEDDGERRGSLTIDGVEPEAARGRAGLVLQDPDAQAVLARVGDDVAFGCENLGVAREQIWPRVDAALAAVGLDLPREHPTGALSGGQKQRLALAGLLAMRPGLVLLDEPTANLDPDGARAVRDAVHASLQATGATAIIVEHRTALWLPVVDRVVVVGDGGVVADGAPDTVFARHGADLVRQGIWVPGHSPAVAPPPASAGELLLRARDLAVARPRALVAVEHLDLDLRAGEALAVLGPNGAGKSTLALTLGGLLAPAAGEVRAEPVLAGALGPAPVRWRARDLLTRIGVVFQEPEHQLLARTVRDELQLGPRALGRVDPERTEALLDRLRLTHLADAHPFTLSGGEKRRLTVGAALATAPRVLLLDEPTFGQDARTWAEVVALLAEVRDHGTAVGVVTHDVDVVQALRARSITLASHLSGVTR